MTLAVGGTLNPNQPIIKFIKMYLSDNEDSLTRDSPRGPNH